MPTKIEWCDETINPIQDKRKGKSGRGYHCTKCSPGCLHCYAERINKIRGNGEPFNDSPVQFELIESELEKVRKWKKPRVIFVQSMGDLFHERVLDDQQYRVFDVLSTKECKQHTFLFLTKRPHNLNHFINLCIFDLPIPDNFYFGLTICNQQEADEKISIFLQVPGKKFLSIEPMLGEINFSFIPNNYGLGESQRWYDPLRRCAWYATNDESYYDVCKCEEGIDAVILGGETGAGARPMHPEWVRSVRDQCAAAGVDFFLKSGMGKRKNYYSDEIKEWGNCDHELWACLEDGHIGTYPLWRQLDGRTHDELPWRRNNNE